MQLPDFPHSVTAPVLLALFALPLGTISVGCGDDGAASPGTGGVAATGGAGTDPGTGGEPALGGAPSEGGAPSYDGFTLVFHDDFDSIDTARWQKAAHSFDENAAQFVPDMVFAEDGQLVLRMEPNPTPDAENPYVSGELRTLEHYSYGRFEVRAKFAGGSGLVGSLFTYYDHWSDPAKPENWNELDIEFLGGSPDQIQFNVIHWNASSARTTHEHHVDVSYSPSEEFHDYAIEWLPTVVNFYIDNELVHSQTDQIAEFVNLPQRMMMNLWPVIDRADMNGWAGQFDDSVLPVESRYEWARLYQYNGQ